MTYTNVQNTAGTRVTAGTQPWSVSKQYASNVTTGNMLVAIVSRVATVNSPPTVGQVSDDQGNPWHQVVECSNSHYGVDMWVCESCVATATKPTVTALQVGYPNNTMTGINIQIMEYSGCSGFALVDQIAQATITTTSVTPTTNYNLSANHELAISAVIGNMTAATIPSNGGSWNSRLADTTQKCYIADLLDTGGSSAGSTLAANWTVLTADTAGVGILATFIQTGVAVTSPHLVQYCFTDIALGGALTTTKVSQPYPVNPKAGNLLVAIIAGGVFTGLSAGSFPTFPVYTVTDTAGNSWRWGGESGLDPTEGVDWGVWFCIAKGGATTLTATFPQPSEAAQFNLFEFAGYPFNPILDSYGGTEEGALRSVSTNAAILAGDFGIAMRGYILGSGPVAPASGWQMVHSDTSGNGNAQCILSTAAGVLTATYTEAGGQGAVDIVVWPSSLSWFRRSLR